MKQFIVGFGTLGDGYSFVGTFDSYEVAEQYADDELRNEVWEVFDLHPIQKVKKEQNKTGSRYVVLLGSLTEGVGVVGTFNTVADAKNYEQQLQIPNELWYVVELHPTTQK